MWRVGRIVCPTWMACFVLRIECYYHLNVQKINVIVPSQHHKVGELLALWWGGVLVFWHARRNIYPTWIVCLWRGIGLNISFLVLECVSLSREVGSSVLICPILLPCSVLVGIYRNLCNTGLSSDCWAHGLTPVGVYFSSSLCRGVTSLASLEVWGVTQLTSS